MKCAKIYPNAIFHVHLDHRDTEVTTEELRAYSTLAVEKTEICVHSPPSAVQGLEEDNLPADDRLILGASTFRINDHHNRPDALASKAHVSSYVLERAGIRDRCRIPRSEANTRSGIAASLRRCLARSRPDRSRRRNGSHCSW